MDNVAEYYKRSGGLTNMPRNEYEHAEGLLHSEYNAEEEFLRASQIVDKYVQLCNIADGKMARCYQIDAYLLTFYRDMADREPEIRRSFIVLVHSLRNELLITKAVKGKERDKQGALGGAQTQSSPYGYGEAFPSPEQQEKKGNFFQRLLRR